jgi:hypothetical protein
MDGFVVLCGLPSQLSKCLVCGEAKIQLWSLTKGRSVSSGNCFFHSQILFDVLVRVLLRFVRNLFLQLKADARSQSTGRRRAKAVGG